MCCFCVAGRLSGWMVGVKSWILTPETGALSPVWCIIDKWILCSSHCSCFCISVYFLQSVFASAHGNVLKGELTSQQNQDDPLPNTTQRLCPCTWNTPSAQRYDTACNFRRAECWCRVWECPRGSITEPPQVLSAFISCLLEQTLLPQARCGCCIVPNLREMPFSL